MLERLSVLLLFLSLALWLATNYTSSICEEKKLKEAILLSETVQEDNYVRKNTDNNTDTPHNFNEHVEDIINWLKIQTPPEMLMKTSVCPAVTLTMNIPHSSDGIIMMAIGEINITFHEKNLNELVRGILMDEVGKCDFMVSSLTNVFGDDMEYLRPLSDPNTLVMSLANQHILGAGERIVPSVIHSLESIDIKWLGLNAKQYEIITTNEMKIGILAFCGVHGHCTESGSMPFAPVRYSVKTAREAVTKLKQLGVDTIVVLVYWGKEHSFFPDETALYVARHLSELPEVSVVIGHNPQHVQGHAYFGNTLVLFTPGNFLITDNSTSLCWKRVSYNQWKYSNNLDCLSVHPALRHTLLERELQTRIYKIKLKKSVPPIAEYVTIPLDIEPNSNTRLPTINHPLLWTTVCGDKDYNCLSCRPY